MGAMILDPRPPSAIELHLACKKVTGDIGQLSDSDIVVLVRPHGISLTGAVGVYMNECVC